MPRPERFTPAGVPVHVTQRGNFRQPVFGGVEEYQSFLGLLGKYSGHYRNRVVGYCLMPNHFHLVVIPEMHDGVSDMVMAMTSAYARHQNEKRERQGHVWQGRFGSASMSERHYRTALAYVDLNPVRAGLVRVAAEYRWSSAAAHAGVTAAPGFLDCAEFARMYTSAEWLEILTLKEREEDVSELRRATRRGTVAGNAEFVKELEKCHGRVLARRNPGRPRKQAARAAGEAG
jgi:putative transposase